MEEGVSKLELATFGCGCFWCVEAVFKEIEGVESVTSGYMGGIIENPSYNDICTGLTQHAEVVQIAFNPDICSYKQLLDLFWRSHDPTTLNRQGADVGTQYRSEIFHHNDAQRTAAEESKSLAEQSGRFSEPIVTGITSATKFFPAEEYHQDFYRRNPNHRYCQLVIQPKIEKMKNRH